MHASRHALLASSYLLPVRAIIYVYAVSCFSFVTADPDLWGHVTFGQAIWEHRAIPATDCYSYTADGLPWINHEWLTEVLFYVVYSTMGSTGLLGLKLVIGLFIVHLLSSLYLAKERNPFTYIVHFVLFIHVLAPGFLPRPQLMTYLFLTLLVTALQRFFDGQRRALIWTPLIILLWVNSHGGVVAGMGIYAIVVATEGVRCLVTRDTQWRPLLGCFLLSCLAALVNPYGPTLWEFFYQSLLAPRDIEEWAPIQLLSGRHWQFKTMTLLALTTFVLPTKKRPWEVAVILFAMIYGFKHQRHSVLAAILMTPYVPLQWASIVERFGGLRAWFQERSLTFHAAVHGCLIGFAIFQVAHGFHTYWAAGFKIVVEPDVYPVRAVEFMRANAIDGNILVPFEWGEYLIWKRPGSRVSIDGRFRTVYPERVIEQSWSFSAGRVGWQALVENEATEIVLTRKSDHGHYLLGTRPGWQKIYDDPVSAIWIRKPAPPSPLLRKFYDNALVDGGEALSLVFP
jgi:hypothetical protein